MVERVVIGDAVLLRGDCREAMHAFAGADALISDPPYGIGYSHSGGGVVLPRNARTGTRPPQRHAGMIVGDDRPFDPSPWLGFPRVVLWGANHFARDLPAGGCWLVWDKRDGMAQNDFGDVELAWAKGCGNASRLFRHLWNGVCQASEKNERRLHPNQKPLALMGWCIDLCRLKPGALVVDPYAGSGSLGVAAVRRGLRYVGCEIDPRHFATAVARIEAAHRQPPLPLEPPLPRPVQGSLLGDAA